MGMPGQSTRPNARIQYTITMVHTSTKLTSDMCKNSGWSSCPLGWTGPIPAAYWSFDTEDTSFTHHGSQLMQGKVG